MEPRREGQKPKELRPEEKPKRFRLIKLEERIAPTGNGPTNGRGNTCVCGHGGGHGLSIE